MCEQTVQNGTWDTCFQGQWSSIGQDPAVLLMTGCCDNVAWSAELVGGGGQCVHKAHCNNCFVVPVQKSEANFSFASIRFRLTSFMPFLFITLAKKKNMVGGKKNNKNLVCLYSLNRAQQTSFQTLSRNCRLQAHLHRLKSTQDPFCICQNSPQTSEHIQQTCTL